MMNLKRGHFALKRWTSNILLFLQREMCYEFTIYKFIKPTYKALAYILSFRNEGSMKYLPQI